MSYLLASSKRQKGSSSKEKHNPNQTIFLLFSEHHPQICSFWFIFLMFGHTCRIPCTYHRETQAGFYCNLANLKLQKKGKLRKGSRAQVINFLAAERVWCACSKLDWRGRGGSVYAVTAFLWRNSWLGKVMSFIQDSLCHS